MARPGCDGGRAPPSRRTAERQVQPRLRPIDGDLPPPRRGGETARRRIAGRLPERRLLPDHGHGDRARAHPHPLPGGALHGEGRAGHLVADARAAPPHQPDLHRAGPVRARRGHAAHPPAEPDIDRKPRAGRVRGRRRRARPRHRRGLRNLLRLHDRVRRRTVGDAPEDRGEAGRHGRGAARPVHLHPGAAPARRHARQARLGDVLPQPPAQRQHVRHRRPGDLADPQLPQGGRARLRAGRPRRVHPPDPRRRRRFRIRGDQQGGLDRPPARRGQVPRPARLPVRRRLPPLGADGRVRHERRHRGRDEPLLAARGASEGLGPARHPGRLRGGAPADHRAGLAIRHEPRHRAGQAARRGAREHRGPRAGGRRRAREGRQGRVRPQRRAVLLRRAELRLLLRRFPDHRLRR